MVVEIFLNLQNIYCYSMLDSQAIIFNGQGSFGDFFQSCGTLLFKLSPDNIYLLSDLSIVIYYDGHHGRMTVGCPGEFFSSIKVLSFGENEDCHYYHYYCYWTRYWNLTKMRL